MTPESRAEWLFLFILLIGLEALAFAIGLGHVFEKSSYGLPEVLNTLRDLTAVVVGYKFGKGLRTHDRDADKGRPDDTKGQGLQPLP